MTERIRRVAITGGTHGNEFTGVYLVKKWRLYPELVQRRTFETKAIQTNVEAFKQVRRYIDRDLNRAFKSEDLKNYESVMYEDVLAKKLNALLGPKGDTSKNVDFIVDLHTTTANMGLSIVLSNESDLTLQIVAYLVKKEPQLKVYRWKGDEEDAFVDSIAKHGFAIEVGPVPQGVLRADKFLQTERLVYHILDYLDSYNRNEACWSRSIEIYDHVALVDYPRDADGDIIAMVHPQRQDRDYELIHPGDPLFLTLEGKTIAYDGERPLYGLFINEAAYYEKGFALCLAEKKTLSLKK
ncbi:MAG: aspartoacylase [Campylobacteraceae bacterium 4484_4]|nr:MAG: aspartoacylase [Campylobacteraceae bacterium 4484_4]